MRREVCSLLLAGLLAGCGTPAGSDAGLDAGFDAGVTTDAGQAIGTFQVLHTVSQFGDSSAFLGKLFDGPTPATTLFTVDLTDGDCRVEVPRVPFCATPCGGSAACVADNVCQPYPTSRSAGTVRVSGLLTADGGTGPVELTAINNGYQVPAAVRLATPPFADGATVTLDVGGTSTLSPFSIATSGVAPLALSQPTYTLAPNAPLDLQWTAGSIATAARIEVEVDISHHGGLRGQVVCDTADDGALAIGAGLTTRLINLGVSGFPTIKVRRVKQSARGQVNFKVVSGTEVSLTIPGLTSCTDDSECPLGQTCQTDLRCQ
jgi:hypothetical protein